VEASELTIRQRLPALAISTCVAIGLAATLLVVTGAVGTDTAKPGSKPLHDRHPSEAAAELAGALRVKAGRPVVAGFDPAAFSDMAKQLATGASDTSAAAAEPIVVASLAPVEVAPPPSLAAPMGTESQTESVPAGEETTDYVAILDECFVLEICVDHYLWELYQRTAKQDTNKVWEWRHVKVKKKRKIVTVKQRFTRLVAADFTWKDPDAAEKVGMSLMDYVIGGMDRDFKLRLFQTLRAAEKAGLSPGITSGFRDDYRQSIASGQKAASNRSYHGGSLRGGYGHGVAADVVSTKGANRGQRWISTVALWTWIDANEQQTGIGRPYLGRDPPHVAPIDGEEYVSRRGSKTDVAEAKKPEPEKKQPVQVAGQLEKQGAKPAAKLKQAAAARTKQTASARMKQAAAKPKPATAARTRQAAPAERAARNAKPKAAPVRAKLASAKRS
jgi:hypothetical protein